MFVRIGHSPAHGLLGLSPCVYEGTSSGLLNKLVKRLSENEKFDIDQRIGELIARTTRSKAGFVRCGENSQKPRMKPRQTSPFTKDFIKARQAAFSLICL